MQQVWSDNRKPLLDYLKLANTGIRGVVTNAQGEPLPYVIVQIDAREPYFKTSATGEYYRLLLPGKYRLTLTMQCNDTASILHSMSVEISASTGLHKHNIKLNEAASAIYLKHISNKIVDKYPVFCSDSTKPPACATKYKIPATKLIPFDNNSAVNYHHQHDRLSNFLLLAALALLVAIVAAN